MRNTLMTTRLAGNLFKVWLGLLLLTNTPLQAADIPEINFTVKKYVVEGDNPLSAKQTQKLLAPFTGEHKGLSRIEQAAETLEDALHDRYYPFHRVTVPPQHTADGIIKLKIISFKLDRILVEGNEHFSEKNILAGLPALRPGKAPNTLEISRSLLVANEHPSKRTAIFVRNSRTPGHIDARVETRDMRPLQFFTSFDNTGDKNTGRTRLSLGCQHSNLFNRDHTMTLSYTTSPEEDNWSDINQYGIFYKMPIYPFNAGLSLFYTRSKANQGTVGDFFQVSGRGTFAGISMDYTLYPMEYYSHKLSVGLSDRLFENNTRFINTPVGRDVRSRPISFQYIGRWEKAKIDFDYYLEYLYNVNSGSHNETDAYIANRADADRNWDAVRFGANFDYTLPYNWWLHTRLKGQIADEPLISGEQFGLGGARSVRGFEEREMSGDSGQQLNIEIWSPPIGFNIQIFGFIDMGRWYMEKSTPWPDSKDTIAGTGIGLKWRWKDQFICSFHIARVINGSTVSETDSGDDKIHFNLFFRF